MSSDWRFGSSSGSGGRGMIVKTFVNLLQGKGNESRIRRIRTGPGSIVNEKSRFGNCAGEWRE